MKPDVYNMTAFLASKFGIAAATEVAEFEFANAKAVETFAKESGADCEYFVTRAVDVQLSEPHNASIKAGYDSLLAAGVDVTRNAFYMHGKDAEMVSNSKSPFSTIL